MVLGDARRAAHVLRSWSRCRRWYAEAMLDGAVGLSTALQYAPAPYAKTDELIALASEAASYGGIYATHMRSEGDAETEAIDEAIRIGREAHIPVEIWHLKAAGKANWGRMPQIVAQDRCRCAQPGVDISANTYAYTGMVQHFFGVHSAMGARWRGCEADRAPEGSGDARAHSQGHADDGKDPAADWDNEWQEIPGPEAILVAVVQNPELLPLQGKRLSEIAALWHEDPIDALCDLLIKDKAFTSVAVFGMDEPDVALALKQPWVSIDNDSQGTSPRACSGRSIRIRVPTGPFRASCASTCARSMC